MAIIIPSKNIYEIDNQKIKKNIIDNVTVEQTIVSEKKDFKVVVSSIQKEHAYNQTTKVEQALGKRQTSVDYTWLEGVYISYNPKISHYRVTIPKTQENSFVNYIYRGFDANNNPNIQISIISNVYKGIANGKFKGVDNTSEIKDITTNYKTQTDETITFIPPKEIFNEYQNLKVDITSQLYEKNKIDISGNDNYFDGEMAYIFEIYFISEYEEIKLGGESEDVGINTFWDISGTCSKAIAKEIKITVYGDTIGIDLTDGSKKVGSGNKPYSLSGNELLQDSGKVGETPLTKHLANNVLNHYVNGKETATLLCDINEYYRQKDNYVFNPSSYNDIRNATYNNDNGIVKQINKDYEFTESVEVDGFYDLGASDNYIFYSPLEGFQLVDSYSTTEIDSGYLTTITLELKNSNGQLATLERDLNINFREDSSITMENPVTISKGESSVVFTCATSDKELVFSPTNQVFSMISKITLSGEITYPNEINKFALYYDDNIIKEWNITTPQILEFEFEKINSNRNIIKFVALGKNIDTFISYWGWWLEYRVPYKFSVNVTNIINGEVSWEDIKIESTVNDTLAISTKDKSKPMTFEIGDEVIPMVYTANGIDEPMSKKKDNSPKVFRIVGKDIIYDGAVWQKIYLQEK